MSLGWIIWLSGTIINSLIIIALFMKNGEFTKDKVEKDYRITRYDPPIFDTGSFAGYVTTIFFMCAIVWMFLVNVPVATLSVMAAILISYILYCIGLVMLTPNVQQSIKIKEKYKQFVNKYFTKHLTEEKE